MSSQTREGLRDMRISISEFISLDGVVQAPGGAEEDTDGGFRHGGWSMPYFDPEVMGAAIGEASADTGAILQGRRTWQVMAGAWPDRAGDEFADFMNTVQKYVVSDTLEDADVQHWSPTTIIRGADLVTEIQKLRDAPGGSVSVMGSATLVRSLLQADLVDDLMLMIEPIALGGGKRVFPDDGEARGWDLQSTAVASTGVIVARYVRAR
jgi:dihydrofolate reductase